MNQCIIKKGKVLFVALLSVLSFGLASAQTLQNAIKLTDNEQFETASAVFKKLVSQQPSNGNYYFYYGENYFKENKRDSAKLMYQKGISENPDNALNYVGLGKIQWYNKDEKDAKASFYKALTISQSKNATVMTKIAEVYINADNKDISSALELLNKAEKLDPKNPEVYIQKGDAYLAKNNGNGSQAVVNYEKAVNLDSTSVRAVLRLGELYGQAQNYQLAFKYYEQANKINPNFAPAYREKAELLYQAGQIPKAIDQYKKFLALNNDLSARERYASFLFLSKNYQQAVTEINKIMQHDTTNPIMYRLLAYSQYETKDYKDGMTNINKFFAKAPQRSDVKILPSDYGYKGKLLLKSGQDSLGILTMKHALTLDSTSADLYSDIAMAYFSEKKFPQAIDYFQKKIALGNGATLNDYNALGRAYYLNKQYKLADSAYATIVKARPDLPLGYYWRAACNAQLDSTSELGLAKPYYEQYIQHAIKDSARYKSGLLEAYSYLGYYYFLQKDTDNAKLYWGKVRAIDPTNKQQKAFFNSLKPHKTAPKKK